MKSKVYKTQSESINAFLPLILCDKAVLTWSTFINTLANIHIGILLRGIAQQHTMCVHVYLLGHGIVAHDERYR